MDKREISENDIFILWLIKVNWKVQYESIRNANPSFSMIRKTVFDSDFWVMEILTVRIVRKDWWVIQIRNFQVIWKAKFKIHVI